MDSRIDRRKHSRWTQAERYLPPVRPWWCYPKWVLPVVVVGLMILNAAPGRIEKLPGHAPEGAFHVQVAAPNCTRYTGLIPADASVVEWCIRVYNGT